MGGDKEVEVEVEVEEGLEVEVEVVEEGPETEDWEQSEEDTPIT